MEIKPIETFYNGYRFRSRLEAKCAVFFDDLNLEYRYELEGYVLDDGTKYLPDFYLPTLGYYVEVKGVNNHLAEDLLKVAKFCRQKRTNVIIISDIPYGVYARGLYIFPVFYYSYDSRSGEGEQVKTFGGFFRDIGGKILFTDTFAIGSVKEFFNIEWAIENLNLERLIQPVPADGIVDDPYPRDAPGGFEDYSVRFAFADELAPIERALLKARGARFEHGEHGGK